MMTDALERIEVLDHGYVELIDVMGSDADIEAAARVSFTGGETEERSHEQRVGLIRFLMRKWHTTPFEMAVLKFRVRLPIFVARQWHRHRMASINEISGRYATLPDLYYVPKDSRIAKQSTSNKQGSGDAFEHEEAVMLANGFHFEQLDARERYEGRVAAGMALELARINLPVSQYTEMIWKADLHNLLHFLRLRIDAHAQGEIREYGEAMATMVKSRFPISWEAFEDFRLNAVTLTAQDVQALRQILGACRAAYSVEHFKTAREEVEFRAKLDAIMSP